MGQVLGLSSKSEEESETKRMQRWIRYEAISNEWMTEKAEETNERSKLISYMFDDK